MKHVYMLFAAIALEVTGTTFMKFSVMHEWFYRLSGNAFINGLFVLLPQQGSKKITHQRCLRSLGRHRPYGHRLYCLDYF